jgi:predicted nuclease of predicted toxin-antitoxin system
MRFVVDANLPPALATWLIQQAYDDVHTTELGLEAAEDIEIWRYGETIDAIIITKDEDFALLKARDANGPQVVWVRIGNAIRRVLLQRLATAWPTIIEKLEERHGIVEVR